MKDEATVYEIAITDPQGECLKGRLVLDGPLMEADTGKSYIFLSAIFKINETSHCSCASIRVPDTEWSLINKPIFWRKEIPKLLHGVLQGLIQERVPFSLYRNIVNRMFGRNASLLPNAPKRSQVR